MERLQKILQLSGVASRRQAALLIASGKVMVDGIVVYEPGYLVEANQSVTIDGKQLTQENRVYFALNKPTGYITTMSDPKKRKTILGLIDIKERVVPVGRLDNNTSGLLLLTNDGALLNRLIHPRYMLEKEYHVKVSGLLRKETSKEIEKGVDLGDFVTAPAKIEGVRYDDKRKNTYLKIIIYEGRYRQIRRMFECFGHPVLKLKRYRFGPITLEGIPTGAYRPLKIHEVKLLWHFSTAKDAQK